MTIRTVTPSLQKMLQCLMLGGGQASSGFPRLPMAHSPALCRHRDSCSLPYGLCQAQQGAWPGHRGERSSPASSPAGSGEEAGAGGMWQQRFFPVAGWEVGRGSSPSLPDWHQVHSEQLSSEPDPALAQMVYYPLAGTLCLAPPCSAVPLPPPSDPLGSGPGSHLHPPTLPGSLCHPGSLNRLRAGSPWGWEEWLGFPLSFLLWPSKAGRAWASPFPCQHQAGESLPCFSQMLFLPLPQASVCISLSVVCLYEGRQSN